MIHGLGLVLMLVVYLVILAKLDYEDRDTIMFNSSLKDDEVYRHEENIFNALNNANIHIKFLR